METQISDYITTDIVAKVFHGANDLAQAGSAATVEYYWAAALTWTLLGVILIFIGLIACSVAWLTMNHLPDESSVGPVLVIASFPAFVVGALMITANLPAVISPEGAIIYEFVRGAL